MVNCLLRFPGMLLLVVVSFVWPCHAEGSDAATELDTMWAKLSHGSFRKREQMTGRFAATAGQTPILTEQCGNRRHIVIELQIPHFGTLRQEQITVGNRTAARVIAPGIQEKLEEAKRTATAASARALLQQILSVATAMQTGGVSSVQLIRQVATAGLNVKSTAQARAALDQAEKTFGQWQLVPHDAEDEDADAGPAATPDDDVSSDFGGVGGIFSVTKETVKNGKFYRYTRKTSIGDANTKGFCSIVLVDAQNGLPVSEETMVGGEQVMTAEYFDVGSPISIELPDCLK